MACSVTFMAHTDNIEVKVIEITRNFELRDTVIYIPNGLRFLVENNRQLNLMKENYNYAKPINP